MKKSPGRKERRKRQREEAKKVKASIRRFAEEAKRHDASR